MAHYLWGPKVSPAALVAANVDEDAIQNEFVEVIIQDAED